MADTNYETLESWAWRNYGLDLNGAMRVATGINKDLNGIAYQLWGKEFGGSHNEALTAIGGRALNLPGVAGAHITTPDTAVLDLTGDFEMRVEIESVSPTGTNMAMMSKLAASGTWSYEWRINAFGFYDVLVSATGAAVLTSNVGAPDVRNKTIRCVMDADNGASGRTATFYTADNFEGPFTLQATDTDAPQVVIFNGTAPLSIGARSDGASPFQGRIRRARLYNQAGTVVANPDFTNKAPGTTSFVCSAGRTWTIQGTATIS